MVDYEEILKLLADIRERLAKLEVRVADYNEGLKEHMRGVQALEARIIPLEKHTIRARTIIKTTLTIIAIIGTLSGIAFTLIRLLP